MNILSAAISKTYETKFFDQHINDTSEKCLSVICFIWGMQSRSWLRHCEGHRFNSRWCQRTFSFHNPSGGTMALGSTQPLTEMSTRNISWGVRAAGA